MGACGFWLSFAPVNLEDLNADPWDIGKDAEEGEAKNVSPPNSTEVFLAMLFPGLWVGDVAQIFALPESFVSTFITSDTSESKLQQT